MTAARRVGRQARGALALSAGLLAWSLVPLALLLAEVARHGGVLSGSDGMLAGADQQQYLMFIRESGTDGLIANEFRIGDSRGVFLHPMWLVSGVLWRLGVGLELALLVWKPVAAAALGAGAWRYAGRFLAGRARLAAVVLGLFFVSPVLPLLVWTGVDLSGVTRLVFLFTSGEAFPALQLWGYLHAALTIGLLALVLLGVERALDPAGERRRVHLAWISAAGALIGWLHPWKGATLLAILAGLAAWGRLAPRYRMLAIPAAATAAPMLYEALLPRLDADWARFAEQNTAIHAPAWMLVAALVPLVAVALLGVGAAPRDDGGRMLLLWPPAGLAVYFATGQFPYHALQGLTIPLAVLAVWGVARIRLPAAAAVAGLAVLTLPGAAFALDTFGDSRVAGVAPYVLHPDEAAALAHLEAAPQDGGVLAQAYLGMTVPARTGRDTWLGHFPWTPDHARRTAVADALFAGRLSASEARALVRRARPAYLLSDCRRPVDLAPLLGDLVRRVPGFGCAGVYEVTPSR